MTWVTWLLALVAPISKKVLLALGMGFITITGFDLAISAIQNNINTALGQTSAEIFGIASLMGIPDAIGIMLGGIASGATLVATKRFNIL